MSERTVCNLASLEKVGQHPPLQPVPEVRWSEPHHMGTATSKAVWGAVGEAGGAGQRPSRAWDLLALISI